MKPADKALCALLITGTAALVAAAHASLTPQLTQLFDLVGMHGAEGMAFGLTTVLLGAAAMAGARGGKGSRAIAYAVVGLTACVALTRAKVVSDNLSRAHAVYRAKITAYQDAKANRNAAIADAKSDPDLNAKAPYLHRKREARANLARARALPMPEIPVQPASGALTWIIAVGGPAGIEAVTAVLLELLAAGLGAGWALLLGPLWVRVESTKAAPAEAPVQSSPAPAEFCEDAATIVTSNDEGPAAAVSRSREPDVSESPTLDIEEGAVLVGPRGGRYRIRNGRRVYLRSDSSSDLPARSAA